MKPLLKFSSLFMLSLCAIAMSCSDDDEPTAPPVAAPLAVELKTSATLGQYLSANNGKSLYYFASDIDGASKCSGGCLEAWPAFYMETIKVGSGLNVGGFATITRADGAKQTTYKGWPLYYFAGDSNAGDIKGDNTNDFFVAKADYSLMIAKNTGGEKLIVDAGGKTLYRFTNDSENVSTCKDGCLTNWPVFLDETITVPSFFNASDFGTITRVDGAKQTTFKGVPLYYFAQDQLRGDLKGQGVAGKFFIVTEFE